MYAILLGVWLMALNTTALALDLHVLVTVKLTGATRYYAERHVAMDDGNWYDGRAQIPSFRTAFQSMTEPRQEPSIVTLVLDNYDEGLDSDLSTYVWGNRDVEVRVGEGVTLANYSLIFAGYVQFPAGITRDDDTVTLTLIDNRVKDNKTIPAAVYDTTTFPNCDAPDVGRGVLQVYGDYVTTSPQTLRAAAIDTTLNLFEVAGHTIGGISQVYRNGVATASSLVSLSPRGRFTLTTFTGSSDTVSARLLGKTGLGVNLTAITTLEHPMDILYDFLTDQLGVAAARIDSATFTTLKTATPTMKVRRVLDSPAWSEAHIAELCNNIGCDFYVDGGCYAVKLREPVADTQITLNDADLVPHSFRIQDDPERLFANRIVAKYNHDPANARYSASYTLEGTTSQTTYLQTVERTLTLPWHFQANEAQARTMRELLLFQNPVKVVTASFKHRTLLKKLTDVLNLDWSIYNDTSLQVRGAEYDWNTARARFDLWDVLSFIQLGRWTLDSAPSYYAATLDQQKSQGFWADTDGTVGISYLILDTFGAANGTGMTTRLMDRGGTWNAITGTWEIQDQQGSPLTLSNNEALIIVGATLQEGQMRATISRPTSAHIKMGIVFHYQDADNFWRYILDSAATDQHQQWQRKHGIDTKRGSINYPIDVGTSHIMTVGITGLQLLGDVVGPTISASWGLNPDDSNLVGVTMGLWTAVAAGRIDNVMATPTTAGLAVSHWF